MTVPAGRPESRGIATPHQPTWMQRLMATLIFVSIRAVAVTLRSRVEDASGLFVGRTTADPVIFSIWHNRLALCLVMYHRHVVRHQPQRKMAAMVSASKDGAMLARILELFERPAGARLDEPARSAGAARTHRLGCAGLRPRHHPGWAARALLHRAEWGGIGGAAHRTTGRAGVLPPEPQDAPQELGPVPGPLALRAVRPFGSGTSCGCRATPAKPTATGFGKSSKRGCGPSRTTSRRHKDPRCIRLLKRAQMPGGAQAERGVHWVRRSECPRGPTPQMGRFQQPANGESGCRRSAPWPTRRCCRYRS